MSRVIRINKVLRELNISLDRAVEFLKAKGYEIEVSPNAKISTEEYEILNEKFSIDNTKKKSDVLNEEKYREKELLRKERELGKQNSINKPNEILLLENKFSIKIINRQIREVNEDTNFNYFVLDSEGNIIQLKLDIIILNKKTLLTKGKNSGLSFYEILSSFVDLKNLELNFDNLNNINDFFDFSFLLRLGNLKHLSISNGKIHDLTSLSNMFSLESLSLERNEIVDISPLANLINITQLNLTQNSIENIDVLEKLKALSYLDLSSNKIEQIDKLSEFKTFKYLNLTNNLISDLTALSSLVIDNLILVKNNLFDLTPIYNSILKEKIKNINLEENLIFYPPLEVVEKGLTEMRRWIRKSFTVAKQKISEFKKSNSTILNLQNCGLTDLSFLPELFNDTEKLEKLILSNEYATLDDNGNWHNNERKGFYSNNIVNLSTDFIKLINLKELYIGGDWNKGDRWNKWRIKDVSFLSELKKLEIVNISNNNIEYVPNLNKLINLKILFANNNFIKNIEILGEFDSLHELYLSNNLIEDVEFLKDLKSIKTIDLHSNNIKDLKPLIPIIKKIGIDYSKWKANTISISENPLDQTLINILNTHKESNSRELDDYFDRLIQGDSIVVKRIKLILLGNTQAGKTTLADILAKTKKANGDSTHGINFFKFKVGEIDVNGYDFGGQDYYHNTHHSFFDDKSLYFVIWGNGQNNKLKLNNRNEVLFPINYWLGSLNKYAYKFTLTFFFENLLNFYKLHLINNEEIDKVIEVLEIKYKKIKNESKEHEFVKVLNNSLEDYLDEFIDSSTINYRNLQHKLSSIVFANIAKIESHFSFQTFLIQNLENNKIFLNEYHLKNQYDFINDFSSFNFLRDKVVLKKFIDEICKEFVKESRVLNIDNKISKLFDKNKVKVILSIDEVKNLDSSINNYDSERINSLLNSLHGILSCFYFKITTELKIRISNSSLDDIVIIDLEKFTEWIYQILNQEEFLNKREGYFSKKEALEWLNDDNAKKNVEYILAFMLQNKLIFKMKEDDRFFSPNYLNNIQTQAEKLFLENFEIPIVKYIFNEYFHTSILSEIINKYFDQLVLEDTKKHYVLWKNKLILYEDVNSNSNQLVYISFQINEKSPAIFISKYNNLVSDSFILELCEFIESVIKSYDYEKLVKSTYDNYIPYVLLNNINETENKNKSNFLVYEGIIYKRSDFKMFLNDKDLYPMKKVCISYSKEDLSLVNKFKDYLVPLCDDGLIEDPWYCTDLIAGEAWNEKITQKFNEADIIFFMVSENLMKTKYVKEVEIKKAIDRWNYDNSSVKIVPIILEYYHWSREGKYNLAHFTALPYATKPIKDFKDQKMGWFIVVDAIKMMLIENPEKATYSKEVLKILERIVESKVDNNYIDRI
ncbi:leucine-rich repeat domain-containing protein [Flavobacterium sp. xlx-214]|uniref:leucine-rich repeat domain-containing protein n=1 Tax=unclassified Flavobacterium TaxID=196869 RepID=UPI0013D23D53|nr:MULTISPECIES: leucine-rich repeat domain-containing protein [unclassified Flavobacterium]MBA5791684.1 leucine-rich repeat domain-containing protein [Flavobacterium sp. xlx-221]QMI82927.1 leucine-rich repeat domain-containing protein [Flavobacterium sp. xlx-214]